MLHPPQRRLLNLASESVASQPEDRGEFFDPAESKVYRHPTFYTVPDGMEHM